MEFTELNLHPDLRKGIAEAQYHTCMPVQEQVLGHAFGGQDLYVQSQTGTGKTAAFLIVIFQRLLTEAQLTGRTALIMAPTRELAVQIEEEAKMLGKYLPFKIGSFYGGVGYTQQQQLLKDNVRIMVGTPGRVLDLNKSGRMNLMDIAFLVLDEADRMFDMGFYPDLRKLIKVVPPVDRRQTMLFSATLNAWVKNLAWEYTKSPYEIEIEPEIVTVAEIEQILYHVPSEEKMKLLLGILERERPESAIIFCNTKRYTEIVAKRLRINGYDCDFIIGDLPQSRRLKVIEDVKAGKIHFLAATDVAARGLDIEGLSMVINYDLPVEAENYVHRIGRTARAGKTGKAITLATEQDVYELPAIERYIGKKIPSEIAVPELHTDDKSAGMHIRAEFYEDRQEERRVRSGAAPHSAGRGPRPHSEAPRPGGRRRDSRAAEERRAEGDSRRHRGERARGGESRSPQAHGPQARGPQAHGPQPRGPTVHGPQVHGPTVHGPQVRRQRSQGRAGANPAEQAPPAQSAAGQNLSRLSFEERMAYYKQKYDSSAPAAEHQAAPRTGGQGDRKKRPGPARPGKDRSTKAGAPPKQRQELSAKVPEQAAAPKGIISRLLGIFKKEKN